MTVNPEVERKPETPPEGVEHRPEEIGVPERIQDVVKKTPTQVTAQVTDDDDQDLIHTPETKEIAIEIPGNQASFEQQAQGSVTESTTWFAAFWVRMIKKARHFGWRIMGGGSQAQVSDDTKAGGSVQDDQSNQQNTQEKQE